LPKKAEEKMEEKPGRVTPLHYVTVDFRLRSEGDLGGALELTGRHRFLYGVEAWLEGVDQRLENLGTGETLELLLEPGADGPAICRLLGPDQAVEARQHLTLELRVIQVVKAEAREVVRALAATVRCCDHCGGH
jgi:hypothetical protein